MENKDKNIENLYRLKVGEVYVEMAYSKNNKSFNECMLNVLNLKAKKANIF